MTGPSHHGHGRDAGRPTVTGPPVRQEIPAADVEIGLPLARGLLAAAAPDLAGLPLRTIGSGWDNVMIRVGDDLVMRLPRREAAAACIRREIAWLPTIARLLDVPLPVPVVVGEPSGAYPYPWAVCPWAHGRPAGESATPAERAPLAESLARAVVQLHVPAPPEVPQSPFRGGPPAIGGKDAAVRERLARWSALGHDAAGLLRRWEAWSAAPAHAGPPVWLHGDLHPGNLVIGDDGTLASVIDWGDLAAGDPACDLATAWLTFDGDGRAAFRAEVERGGALPAATWLRARAWALHLGLIFALGSEGMEWLRAIGEHALAALAADPA